MSEQDKIQTAEGTERACDPRMSRKEFLGNVLKKAALAGTIVAAPKVLDKFLVPPVYALSSTQHFADRKAPSGPSKVGPAATPQDNGGWG